ncbi:MAG: glycine betaine ABC transporter substrate-binding protein [Chlamydiota bacterium]
MKRFYARLLSLLCLGMICLFLLNYPFYPRGKTIIVGAKNNPECQILAEMMSALIEKHTDYRVEKKLCLEGSYVAFHALASGSIDLYVDYTGTLLLTVFQGELAKLQDSKEWENRLSQYGVSLLFPFGFNNSYVLLTQKEAPLATAQDLQNRALRYGFDPEFLTRKEFSLIKEKYQLLLSDYQMMDPALLYFSLNHDSLDVISASETDGNILLYPVKILRIDRGVFPSYEAVCLASQSFLQGAPEALEAICPLRDQITLEKMRQMNYALSAGKSASDIAKIFLQESGL